MPNHSCVLTDTNFVYDTIMTKQDVTYKDRDLSSSGSLVMPQAASRRPLFAKAGTRSQSSPYGICGERSGIEIWFLQAGLLRFYPVSIIPPVLYSNFAHLPSNLYSLSNWNRRLIMQFSRSHSPERRSRSDKRVRHFVWIKHLYFAVRLAASSPQNCWQSFVSFTHLHIPEILVTSSHAKHTWD